MPQQKLTLGDVLLREGLLSAEQMARARKLKEQLGCRLGEAVVKLGLAGEEAVVMALAKVFGVTYASRENKILAPERDQNLQNIVEERFARENALVPLFRDENILAVAMSEPDNVMVLDNLKLMTGYDIQPFIASKAQIIKTIDEFYQSSSGTSLIEKVMAKPDARAGEASEADASEARIDLDKMVAQAEGEQMIALVNAVLKQAVHERCSDIHLERYDERVMLRFRIDGVLYERTPPDPKSFNAAISRIKIMAKLDIAERRLPQDGAFSFRLQNRTIDVRVSICPTVFGEKAVLRILDKGAVELSVDKMGFEPRQKQDFLKAAHSPHGLIFLTGPTGSGKTTTLYTILSAIKTPEMNFMTVEDPVELKLEGINQVQVKPSIGLTFASALRSFLRQDPDVILVGEVRDQETAETCLRAALTGHLVLSTLHTNSALEAVVRLGDMGIEPFLLSSTLRLVAAQRLVRTLCAACRLPYAPPQEEVDLFLRESALPEPPEAAKLTFYKARGCPKCARTGYSGRLGIFEVYPVGARMREAIYRRSGDLSALRAAAAEEGAWDMRASAWRKVLSGQTSAEEVLSITAG